jgi:hypothetical protein
MRDHARPPRPTAADEETLEYLRTAAPLPYEAGKIPPVLVEAGDRAASRGRTYLDQELRRRRAIAKGGRQLATLVAVTSND